MKMDRKAAWEYITNRFGIFAEDVKKSENAGYPVYVNGAGEWVSDLNTRLEINLGDGDTINVWLEEEIDAENMTIMLQARDNDEEVRFYDTYRKFIADWRFWFSSGRKYKEDEELFEKIVDTLIDVDIHGASTEILRSGLYIKFKLK